MPSLRPAVAAPPLVFLLIACGGGTGGSGATPAPATSAVVGRIDSIAQDRLKTGPVAGFSIGVMKGQDTILLKGYGKADLELDVPTPSHAVYEIGSVTKQFTGAAILQLRDAGKLSLDDNISKYLPDFPTQGNTITVRQLLNHTSGIRGYTEMASVRALMAQDLPRDTLVKLVRREKFDFPTGTALVYNNSAYFLAGLIIEKLSGMSYAEYVKKNLFDKAGMRDAAYCSEKTILKGKVKGYDVSMEPVAGDTSKKQPVLRNKGLLVHTWPYAAGSLCASVNDLLAWNRALHGGQVLPAASYADLIAPAKLNDGTTLRYGLGLSRRDVHGHALIEHGGGIFGFVSASHHYPDDSLTVVVLLNTAGPVDADKLARDVAFTILEKRTPKTEAYSGDLAQFAGTYRGVGRGEAMQLEVAVNGNTLTIQAPQDSAAKAMQYLGNDLWMEEENRLHFAPAKGTMLLHVDQIYGYSTLTRTKP